MFDKLYAVVDGHCMYQGTIPALVPFLAEQQLVCPSYHNPADYCEYKIISINVQWLYYIYFQIVLEVAVGEHQCDLNDLIEAANKKYYVDANQEKYTKNENSPQIVTAMKGMYTVINIL